MRGQWCHGKACLHAASIVLRLGHTDVKSSLLISGSGRCNCSTGLLVGTVDGQLIKRDLKQQVGKVCCTVAVAKEKQGKNRGEYSVSAGGSRLHAAGIMLSLGHTDVEAGLLIRGIMLSLGHLALK